MAAKSLGTVRNRTNASCCQSLSRRSPFCTGRYMYFRFVVCFDSPPGCVADKAQPEGASRTAGPSTPGCNGCLALLVRVKRTSAGEHRNEIMSIVIWARIQGGRRWDSPAGLFCALFAPSVLSVERRAQQAPRVHHSSIFKQQNQHCLVWRWPQQPVWPAGLQCLVCSPCDHCRH